MKIKDQGFYIIRKDEQVEIAPTLTFQLFVLLNIALCLSVFALLYLSYYLAQNHEPKLVIVKINNILVEFCRILWNYAIRADSVEFYGVPPVGRIA